jgi:hypothetical protein
MRAAKTYPVDHLAGSIERAAAPLLRTGRRGQVARGLLLRPGDVHLAAADAFHPKRGTEDSQGASESAAYLNVFGCQVLRCGVTPGVP